MKVGCRVLLVAVEMGKEMGETPLESCPGIEVLMVEKVERGGENKRMRVTEDETTRERRKAR